MGGESQEREREGMGSKDKREREGGKDRRERNLSKFLASKLLEK